MATQLLISKADFPPYVDLATNLDATKKVNPQILAAQDFDLCGLMGNAFYADMINKYQDENYAALIAGGTYTVDGVIYSYEGLKPVLVYFASARILQTLDMHITPNAIMAKRNDFSDPIPLSEKIYAVRQYENAAVAYWDKAVLFLKNNNDNYPLWKVDCGCEPRRRARTIAVGADYDQTSYRNGRR